MHLTILQICEKIALKGVRQKINKNELTQVTLVNSGLNEKTRPKTKNELYINTIL